MCTLRRFSNWPPYKIWYYATYLIKKYKVWLFLYCTHQSIDLQKENTYSCTKSSMLNGRCENSQCARVPRARHGSCRIWQEYILRWWSFIKNIKYGELENRRSVVWSLNFKRPRFWLVNPILHIIIWLTTRVIINNFFHFNKNHL